MPEHPEDASFNPTQIKDIKAADPGSNVNLVEPPAPSNLGDAWLGYPSPDVDVFHDCDGTAGEVRAIVSAVTRFCQVAQDELRDGDGAVAPRSGGTDA